jgi:hypothetical protein
MPKKSLLALGLLKRPSLSAFGTCLGRVNLSGRVQLLPGVAARFDLA